MITVLSEVVYYDLLIYFEFIHFRGLKEYETYTSKIDTMNYLLNVMYLGQPYL